MPTGKSNLRIRRVRQTPALREETSAKVAEEVDRSFDTALEMMAKSGFKLRASVKVSVDPQLPFMGYTLPRRGSFNIVVSGGALGSGMLEGLLVHEMSHIYRMQTGHPSHNAMILEEAVERLESKNRHHDYQRKILHDLLNDIQDLYADDIAFRVLRENPTPVLGELTGFLQSWVKDKTVKSDDKVKDRWVNASIMVHNARAIAQMARHHVEDTGKKAAHANQIFLEKASPDFVKSFDFFRNTLAELKEELTEDEYRALLAEHLDHFIALANGS